MSVEAIINDVMPIPAGAGDSAEIVGFLRRFSNLISTGDNAGNLRRAAALILSLTSRASEAERSLAEQRETSTKYIEMCAAFELLVDRLTSEAAMLSTQLEQQAQEALIERSRFTEESEHLSGCVEQAEAQLAAANADIDELRSKLAHADDTLATVPIASLRAIRTQFESLADEFAKRGDVVSQVMSDIGRCAIDQAIRDATPELEELA